MILIQQKHDTEMKMTAEKHSIEIKNLMLKQEILLLQKEKAIKTTDY